MIVTESFLPSVNGVTGSVLRVLEHLRRQNHAALVVAPEGGPGEHDGVRVVRVPAVSLPGLSTLPVGWPTRAKPWNVAYVQPSRRPDDGRFGENPNRLFKHHQLQVILKPAPDEVQQIYLQSLEAVGIEPRAHDIRFEDDNWESPTLGAWGMGGQVLFDGLEITQFTYFQQVGGVNLAPVGAELTYGLERIAMLLQKVDNVFDLEWGGGVKYGEVRLREEIEQSRYVYGQVDGMSREEFAGFHRDLFDKSSGMAERLLKSQLILPALEYALKCSHVFNILDSSGSVGVSERTAYVLKVRQIAIAIAQAYVAEDPRGLTPNLVNTGERTDS